MLGNMEVAIILGSMIVIGIVKIVDAIRRPENAPYDRIIQGGIGIMLVTVSCLQIFVGLGLDFFTG